MYTWIIMQRPTGFVHQLNCPSTDIMFALLHFIIIVILFEMESDLHCNWSNCIFCFRDCFPKWMIPPKPTELKSGQLLIELILSLYINANFNFLMTSQVNRRIKDTLDKISFGYLCQIITPSTFKQDIACTGLRVRLYGLVICRLSM